MRVRYTNKRKIRNLLINIPRLAILYSLRPIFKLTSFSLNMIGFKYERQIAYLKRADEIITSILKFMIFDVIRPLCLVMLWMPAKIINTLFIEMDAGRLGIKLLVCLVVSFKIIDMLIEESFCRLLSMLVNSIYLILSKIGVIEMSTIKQETENKDIEQSMDVNEKRVILDKFLRESQTETRTSTSTSSDVNNNSKDLVVISNNQTLARENIPKTNNNIVEKVKDSDKYKMELKQEATDIYAEYAKIVKEKYPKADIIEKFAIFISTTIKRNFNCPTPIIKKTYLREFYKREIQNVAASDNRIIEKLFNILNNKEGIEKLSAWGVGVSDNIYKLRIFSNNHEASIEFFEHLLGFVVNELEKKEKEEKTEVCEIDEEGNEVISDAQKMNLRVIDDIKKFMEDQKGYWKAEKRPNYKLSHEEESFNVFRDTGFTVHQYPWDFVHFNLTKSYTRYLKEDLAEFEMKEFISKSRTSARYDLRTYMYACQLIQLCLGEPTLYDRADEENRVISIPTSREDIPLSDYNPESIWIKEADLMTPITVLTLIHYVKDHIRDRYVNSAILTGTNAYDAVKYGFGGNSFRDGTMRPLGNYLQHTLGEKFGSLMPSWSWSKKESANSTEKKVEKVVEQKQSSTGWFYSWFADDLTNSYEQSNSVANSSKEPQTNNNPVTDSSIGRQNNNNSFSHTEKIVKVKDQSNNSPDF